jgi:hypothetical protein
VIATTEGRGGVWSSKSGQRVEGASKARSLVFARVLHRDEERLAVGGEAGAAHLGAARASVEEQGAGPLGAFDRAGADAVRDALGDLRAALIGRDPESPHRVEGAVVRTGEPAILVGGGMVGGLILLDGGVAAAKEDPPLESEGGVIALLALAGRNELDHVAVTILRAWVGGVRLLGRALLVVGEHDVDQAVDRVGLDVLGTIEGRGPSRSAARRVSIRTSAWLWKSLAGVRGPVPQTSGSQRIEPSSAKRATKRVPWSRSSRLASRSLGS